MITLHCGLHKTGSSSIQLALAHARLTGTVVLPRPGDDQSDAAWRSRLARVAAGGVLSDEKLLGSPFDGYSQAATRLGLVRTEVAGRPSRVVVYLRPQPDWLESVYLQGVQEGRRDSPEEFWSRVRDAPLLQWSALIDLLAAESGADAVLVRPYGPGVDVIADFAATCGLPSSVSRVSLRENVSIAAIQAPVLLELGVDDTLTHADRNRLRGLFQRQLAAGASREWSAFPPDVQADIRHRTREDWASVGVRVREVDPVLGERFRALEARWDLPIRPWPTDTDVRAELVRSLRVLGCMPTAATSTSLASRAVTRIRRATGGTRG